MPKARIRLAMWNSQGAVAGIEDDDMNDINLVLHKSRQDPKAICKEAAKRLRRLADDFDRLSTMDEPFKEKTQRVAAKVAS
jgi:hypothetical protein